MAKRVRRYKGNINTLSKHCLPRPGEWWVNVAEKSLQKGFTYQVLLVTPVRVTALCTVSGERRVLAIRLFLEGMYARVPYRWREEAKELSAKLKQVDGSKRRILWNKQVNGGLSLIGEGHTVDSSYTRSYE